MDETPPLDARWRRLAISVVAAAISLLPGAILLPGVQAVPGLPDAGSVGALGIAPYIAAVVLVELAAAIVPRWRKLRIGGHEGRRSLARAAMALAAVFALYQGWMVAVHLEALNAGGVPAVAEPGLRFRAVSALGMAASSALLVWLAWGISQNGLGAGFSVLIGAAALRAVVEPLLDGRAAGAEVPPAGALVAVASGAAAVALAWYGAKRVGPVRVPASGLDPLYTAASLLMLPAAIAAFQPGMAGVAGALAPGQTAFEGARIALALALAVGFGLAYNRPSKVAAAAGIEPEAAHRDVRAAMGRTLLFVGALALLGLVARESAGPLAPDLLSLVVLGAIARDLVAEWRERGAHPTMISVWPEHRVYAVAPLASALAERKIPVLARGLHHRGLMPFFGAFVPIELMVPAARAEDALAVLARKGAHDH